MSKCGDIAYVTSKDGMRFGEIIQLYCLITYVRLSRLNGERKPGKVYPRTFVLRMNHEILDLFGKNPKIYGETNHDG